MKKIILMGEPHHGNIGDNAIAKAERLLIKEEFGEYEFYALGEKFLDICAERAKKYISDDDIILLHGGGNLGDTYVRPEKGRRRVIELFPNNKIILMPQTAYFSDTVEGHKELELTKKIYNNHKNLILMARERESYEFMKKNFIKAKIYLTPDIVMTLNEQTNFIREGGLLLFRTDKEKIFSDESIEYVKSVISEKYLKYIYSDMNLGSGIVDIAGKHREKVLNEKFRQFQTSKVVITDRLHGMIFAAITGTPCVAFGSLDHKIKMSYKWLEHLKYIDFCEDFSAFDTSLKKVTSVKNPVYDNSFAKNIILDILKKEINLKH